MGSRPAKVLPSDLEGNNNGNDNRNAHICRFGIFEADLRAGELRRNGVKVKLQEQPFQVLAQLLERPGEVITRDDLRNHLWPADTFVDFDHSLNAAIRRLRDALGDSAENPTFVETVARRGYRFLAPLAVAPGKVQEQVHVLPEAGPRRRYWIAAVAAGVVLVFLGIVLGFHVARQLSAPYRSIRLTANPIDDPVRAAAVSGDGRYLAFSDDNGFYLRQIETGETHALSVPDGLMTNAISWLPDSAHMIVALADADHKSSLWEISAVGGGARKVLDDGYSPAVSPNGKSIAYISGKFLHQRLCIASISGEQPRVLAGEDNDLFGRIAWSPDGKKIAYTMAKSLYGYGATASIAVTDFPAGDVASHGSSTILSLAGLNAPLAWMSDGRLIYTLQEAKPRQVDTNLWAVRLDSHAIPIGPVLRLTDDSGSVNTVGASADGRRIIYTKGIPQPDVYVARMDRSGQLQTPERLTLDDRQDMPYDWTVDNRSVIFISDRTGIFDIYKQAINATVPDLLVAGTNPAQIPRLSPDGTQILYVSYPSWGDPNYEVPLIRVPLDGGAPQTLLKAKWISNHQCARTPATLCLYSVITDKDLTFYSFDPLRGPGAQICQIKDEVPQMYNWSLSPDGRTLALAKGKWGGGEEPGIRLVSFKSGVERTLPAQGYSGITSIDWAADSKGLWAVTSGEKDNELLHIDLQGNVRPVWRPKNMLVGWAIPSRDGRYLALHIRSASANVWMLERP